MLHHLTWNSVIPVQFSFWPLVGVLGQRWSSNMKSLVCSSVHTSEFNIFAVFSTSSDYMYLPLHYDWRSNIICILYFRSHLIYVIRKTWLQVSFVFQIWQICKITWWRIFSKHARPRTGNISMNNILIIHCYVILCKSDLSLTCSTKRNK